MIFALLHEYVFDLTRNIQPRELKFLPSMYKQRFVHECGYFKRCKKQTDLNMIPNMRVFIIVMSTHARSSINAPMKLVFVHALLVDQTSRLKRFLDAHLNFFLALSLSNVVFILLKVLKCQQFMHFNIYELDKSNQVDLSMRKGL